MALMLALGELQKSAGQDTRVTARADILDENNPPFLGVWKSWEGEDHGTDRKPLAPTYTDHKKAKFLAWLTSATQGAKMTDALDGKAATGKATLLGDKTVGPTDPTKRQVYLTPTQITVNKARGAFAWWVGGENQKARLPRPYAPATDNAATWSVLAKTHNIADTVSFGMDLLLSDASLKDPAAQSPASKAITRGEADLIGASTTGTTKLSQETFHDLSVISTGLLTNTATGGWRKDLSLAAEVWTGLPTSNLPFFRLNPTKDLMFTRAANDPLEAKSLLYHWSDYRRGATGNTAIYSFPPIGSWANLMNWATLYKTTLSTASSSSSMSASPQAAPISESGAIFIHKVRILPVIARVQWLYAHKAKQNTADPTKYDLYLVFQPVFTLWNPYNVGISSMGAIDFGLQGTLPPLIEYKVGGTALPKKITLKESRVTAAMASKAKPAIPGNSPSVYTLADATAFTPGETKVFSVNGTTNALTAGWNPLGGMEYLIASGVGTGSSKITTGMTFDSEFNDGAGADGVGMYLDLNTSSGNVLAYRMLYETSAAKTFYPDKPATDFPTPTLSEALTTTPFLSVTFGARMASNTHLASKGFVQSSPFVFYTAMGKKSTVEGTIKYPYPGTLHNVNSPFEYSFQGLTSGNAYTPGSGTKGYIVTGFQSANGLSRCVIDELPGRPPSSLAELQNWDARYENPIPPYSFNIVGNSDASPLLPSNAVVNPTEAAAKGAENLQNDDSYCLNHVLFDDWFCSSIAAEPTAFGGTGGGSAKTIYLNFLKDATKPLANRSYKPIREDVAAAAVSATNAALVANKNVGTTATSWKTIASRLEVEGMFNVNSTSVKAWRALLGHARNQKIPYMGSTASPTLSTECDYALTRFSVAGDVESKKQGASGGFTTSAEYAGYRVFDAAQLDFLAEQIVKQVRLRGPFLSLSEFVNRQLSKDDGLALAGAIQTALNALAADTSKNPYKPLQKDLSNGDPKIPPNNNVATSSPPGAATGYQYPLAANGYNVYGLPGWTRQADVLRPLAPILTARDDTFTIRAYGDARDAAGTVVKARAVCEATIRRSREYMDPSDDAAVMSDNSGTVPTLKAANTIFGRRFVMVSFRWLSPDEI